MDIFILPDLLFCPATANDPEILHIHEKNRSHRPSGLIELRKRMVVSSDVAAVASAAVRG
jgi:hypothetical protein